jgi:2-phosphosulfolactate phosphatase
MNTFIDVFASASAITDEDVRNKIVVVIDVLRASSTIITALKNGAKEVIAVEDMAAAGKIAQNLDSSRYLLCGEKDGIMIEGYHLGNSPFEYQEEIIKGKTLILSTTNGTKAITKSMYAKKIIVAGFINADAVVEELKKHNGEIALVCAGWKTRISLEDQLCAGYIIRKLMQDVLPDNARDGARMAFVLSEKYENQISEIVHLSNHAMRLIELGFETDIAYCSQLNTTTVIPVLKEGTLINDNGQEKSNSLR